MIIDIILGIIILSILYRGWSRGFLYTAGRVVILILAFILASSFSPLLSAKLYELTVDEAWLDATADNVAKNLQPATDLNSGLENIGLSETYQNILKGEFPELTEEFSKSFQDLHEQNVEYMTKTSKAIGSHLIMMTLRIVSFIILLIAFSVALGFLLNLISKGVNKIPLIGSVNRGLGLALAVVMAVVICGTIVTTLPGLQNQIPGIDKALQKSYIASFLIESRLYRNILDTIF